MSKGTETVLTPCCSDDSIIAAGKRVFPRMIQTAAMAGVPGLKWKVRRVTLCHGDCLLACPNGRGVDFAELRRAREPLSAQVDLDSV